MQTRQSESSETNSAGPASAAIQNLCVQPKLEIGALNDPLEHEADTIADKVLSMQSMPPVNTVNKKNIHRKCAECEKDDEEKMIQRKPLVSFIQRKESSGVAVAGERISSRINSNKGNGNNIDAATRSFMESRFGTDFSDVKVHTGSEAIQMNRELSAKAFTVGNDIYFNEGQYQPGSAIGKHLLAHELTHTVQQNGNIYQKIQKVTDASFEATSGVDQGIANGTMAQDAVMGQVSTVDCGFKDYSISFKFSKAMKGTYPYAGAGGRDVRGIYVKIEASIADKRYCGRCTPMQLIQTVRGITKNASGDMEATDPGNATRRERSGWSNAAAPSRGWRVDTTVSSVKPYVTDLTYHAAEGSETSPAILWDSPGDWTTDRNMGKEFNTCAVCTTLSGRKWVAGCVNWGYYIDSAGAITFRPATPVASCSYSQQVRDTAERWDAISGNTPTGISF